jgi:putative transposase
MYLFSNLKDARDIVEDWRIDYNERRSHTSLGGMTPSKIAEIKELRLFSPDGG